MKKPWSPTSRRKMIDMEQVKRMVEEAEKNQAAESLVFHLTKCYFAPINGCQNVVHEHVEHEHGPLSTI